MMMVSNVREVKVPEEIELFGVPSTKSINSSLPRPFESSDADQNVTFLEFAVKVEEVITFVTPVNFMTTGIPNDEAETDIVRWTCVQAFALTVNEVVP